LWFLLEELDHIVKGEFFQDLQVKAKKMRKKKKDEDSDEEEVKNEAD
jgi:hypothetical protein